METGAWSVLPRSGFAPLERHAPKASGPPQARAAPWLLDLSLPATKPRTIRPPLPSLSPIVRARLLPPVPSQTESHAWRRTDFSTLGYKWPRSPTPLAVDFIAPAACAASTLPYNCKMAHHLPTLAVDGDDHARAVEGHLFHLVPVL